jgi:hypothetical protein
MRPKIKASSFFNVPRRWPPLYVEVDVGTLLVEARSTTESSAVTAEYFVHFGSMIRYTVVELPILTTSCQATPSLV